jgi:hypothetical protein
VADIIILTKDTHEVTVGKKDGPGTPAPNQWGFFPEMSVKAWDMCIYTRFANSCLAINPVNFALSWAKRAVADNVIGFIYLLF